MGSSQQPLLKYPQHSSFNASRPLFRERVVVLGPSVPPGSVRVAYGPFEARQSLPTKLLSLNLENSTEDQYDHATQMDITAHVVSTELRRESPVLRVLFHSGKHFHSPIEDEDEKEEESKLMETCIALKVHNPSISTIPLIATCTPQVCNWIIKVLNNETLISVMYRNIFAVGSGWCVCGVDDPTL